MTAMNAAIESSLNSIYAINEKVTKLQDEARAERQTAVEPFLEALALSGQVSLIVIRGWTPGFNDGEPCNHSTDVYVNIGEITAEEIHEYGDFDFELPDELVDNLKQERVYNAEKRCYEEDADALAHNIALCREHGHEFQTPSKDVMAAIDTLLVETADEEFGTDYYVVYQLKDGKFERSSGEYDCGY